MTSDNSHSHSDEHVISDTSEKEQQQEHEDDMEKGDSAPDQESNELKNNNGEQNSTSKSDATENSDEELPDMRPWYKKAISQLLKFCRANSFLILVVIAILLAFAYPPLGAVYVQPQITATWIAVIFIFVMSGLGLKTEEFSKALQSVYFNAFVQLYNFLVVSSIVFGFSRFLVSVGALSQALADGMTICACLPLTVNTCTVLTISSGGDEAAAVFNCAFGNMVGIFLTPALILGYLGVDGDVDIGNVFLKLTLRVFLPVVVGQLLQKFSKIVLEFVKKYKKNFKTAQELSVVFIIYTVFCKTFSSKSESDVGKIFLMIALQFVFLTVVMILAWFSLKLLFRNKPKLRVMGLFGCTHKTVAMGVPLINAVYENNPNVGLYTLPLLVWHPMQLVIGTFLVPRLRRFVEKEENRLKESKSTFERDDSWEEDDGVVEDDANEVVS